MTDGDRMAARGPLSATFLASAGPGHDVPPQPPEDLEAVLAALVERARAAAPGVHLPASDFAAWLGERCPRDRPLAAALDGMHIEDLYLACGCARGDRAALQIFERERLSAIPGLLHRVERSPAALDEICQTLRERLLVGTGRARPRILDYSGLGTLVGWMRVAALRIALNHKRGAPQQSLDEERLGPAAATLDPELAYLKQRYRSEFAAAFQEALAGLDAKARLILRLHYLDGLNIDRIGALHQVHRATVARWIAGYCRAVQDQARRHLMRALRASPAELDSLERLVESQLEVSIRRALRPEPMAGSA